MAAVHYRYATVRGRRLFYREAGPADAPALVLLHGFPTSSFMFRNLIPRLADKWRIVAPDYPGFGNSDAPPVTEFAYTFNTLADNVQELLQQLGIDRYTVVVQDYGAPVAWRLALRNPESISAIITQNGNAYEQGFRSDFFAGFQKYWRQQDAETEAAVREALTAETTRWQYVAGVADETLVDPDTWAHDYALLARPGNDLIQLQLFQDYGTNPLLYPTLHEYFRESQVPLLAVWGLHDPIFTPEGALAFTEDLPNAEIHLIEGSHFLFETALDEVTPLIRRFLESNV